MKKSPVRNRLALAALVMCAFPLSASACSDTPLVGSVCAVAMDWCPRGYLKADGSLVPFRDYVALYSLISNTYGGVQGQTFGLPDLRGRTIVGTGLGTGATPALTAINLAAKVGAQVTTVTPAQMPLHNHGATFVPIVGPSPITIPAQSSTLAVKAELPVSPTTTGALTGNTVALGSGATGYLSAVKGIANVDDVNFTGPYTSTDPGTAAALLPSRVQISGSAGTAQSTVNVNAVTGGAVSIANAGGSQPVVIQSPALGLTYCVAALGLYPTRP